MEVCSRHPNRPRRCSCSSLCSECYRMAIVACTCGSRQCADHEQPKDPPKLPELVIPEEVPQELQPPPLVRQNAHVRIDLSTLDNTINEIKRSADEKDKQTELMVEKLSARYRKALEDERKQFEARKHELEQTIAMVEIEKQELAQELESRERAKSAVLEVEQKIADNKKKLKKLTKKKKAEEEAQKWDRLSRGGSSQNITSH